MDLRAGGPEAVETFLFARPVQKKWWDQYETFLVTSDEVLAASDTTGPAETGPVWVYVTPRQACLGLVRILSSMPRLVEQYGEDLVIQGFAALKDSSMNALAEWWLDWKPPHDPESPDVPSQDEALGVIDALERFCDETQGSPLAECADAWLEAVGRTCQYHGGPVWHAFDRLLADMLASGLMPRAAHAWRMRADLHGSSGKDEPVRPANPRADEVRRRLWGNRLD